MPNTMYRGKPLFHFEDMGHKTPCWIWDRTLVYGYGQTRIVGADGLKNKAIYAHIWMWQMMNGPKPEGLQLDHLCKVRRCCRPDHLELVTNAVNSRRGSKAKLNDDAVRQIRMNIHTVTEYAKKFGVSGSCVRAVVRGETWV